MRSGYQRVKNREKIGTQCSRPSRYRPERLSDKEKSWGEKFVQQFDRGRPLNRQAALQFSLGLLALNVMLNLGGNDYFRTRVVDQHLQNGRLKRIEAAPEFSYPIYLACHQGHLPAHFDEIKRHLNTVLKRTDHWPV